MNYSKSLSNPIFSVVSDAAEKLGYPAYVVGGWVRDLLINRKKEDTDIDFVCIGSGIILAQEVKKKIGFYIDRLEEL